MKFPALFLSLSCLATAESLTAKREGSQVVVRAGDKEILRYQGEPGPLPRPEIPEKFRRGGYIQSIHTMSGRLVTDDFPADHFHHHGVWNPWTKTEFEGRHPDFWNMGTETGKVDFVALDDVWQKDSKAGFTSRHQSVDLTANPSKVALTDTWEISVFLFDGKPVIDFTSTQTCASGSPLKLPTYHYGGFGFRGNAAWIDKKNCKVLAASGQTNREKLNTSPEKWCWIGGKVDGETCGVTLLCHPKNFRFPQPVRMNPDQPFFCYAPQQLGEMEIKPGEKYISRYRIIVTDGEPDAKEAEAWWKVYADGP